LDEACRLQQIGEGWFESLETAPTDALSLTVPAIMRCGVISVVAPDERKVTPLVNHFVCTLEACTVLSDDGIVMLSQAKAVFGCLHGAITTDCPGSILQQHPNCKFWLDSASASLL